MALLYHSCGMYGMEAFWDFRQPGARSCPMELGEKRIFPYTHYIQKIQVGYITSKRSNDVLIFESCN
eukprot:8160302-Ditylum_brightwellii.AAC.1